MKFKKRNLFSTPLLAAMCMFVSVPVCAAEKVEYRQVYYNIDEESLTATATYMTLNPEEVNYPSGSSTFYIGKPVEWQEKSYTVYEIGEYAFLNSAKPYNINLDGETLKKIGKSAFRNSSVRTFRFNDVAIEEICDSAFYHVANFSISDFPESLLKIGHAAFMDVQDFSVRNLSLTGSIKSIGDYAFANENAYLKTLAFGDNISSIGRHAFKGCTGITEISVSADVPPSISEDTFEEDVYKAATLIVKSESLDAYKAADGWKNFINVRGVNPDCYYDEPLYYSLDSEHKTATVIRHDSYKTLSEVRLPSAVEYFGEDYDVVAIAPEAFMECGNLTGFTGSWKLNSLGERCFKGCSSLENVSSVSNVAVIPEECFSGCESLSDISLYCTVISDSAFKGCVSIGEFTTPAKLEEIGECAFEDCTGIYEIVINDPLQKIGDKAFAGCEGIAGIKIFSKTLPSLAQNSFSEATYMSAHLLYSVDMQEDLENSAWKLFTNYSTYDFNHTQIDDLFYKLDSKEKLALVTYDVAGEDNYAGLSRIVIPSEVEYEGVTYKTNGIAASAFESCKDLEYVQLRCDKSQVTIEDRAFANCEKLTEFNDNGDRVGFFGKSVFENCPKLTTFTMPEYLKEIGDSCFKNDTNLKTVVFNSGINKIGVSAFENCSALDRIVVPEKLTSIPAYAFKGCAALGIVNIPMSVSEIGEGAFAGCDKIMSIYLHASVPANIDGHAFSEAACTGANVYVPEGSVAAYRASGWNVFANIKEGDTDRIKIGHYYYVLNNADNTAALTYSDRGEDNYKGMTEISIPEVVSFDGREFTVCAVNGGSLSMCANLQTLTLPSTLKTIKDSSITQNPELETINISEGLETIEGFSIRKNPKLVNITLPGTLTSLGNYAFDHNTSLREIVIPDQVPSIGEEVFYDCPSLEKVTIGKSVTYLNYMSFRSCGSLKEIRVLAQMPPRWGASVFDNSAYETVTVIVPEESLQQYMEDSNWSKFLHIEAERSSGVSEIGCRDMVVKVNGRVIEVSGLSENEYMEIYDIAGHRIYSGNPMGVCVTPGVYIVKAGGITGKIIVKS